ncbi:bifunctional metallophosphatase/5'-nucleotidase [Halobacillus shinanisalinarum]|uniref:Bifunctional metallophosphatase/5'-nucleotidase n=1 Tax=Halobacillus shinanisalinarum TaxID=2932258 RepID=A0ABY4H246_9BACI|nr:bifunctional UDP-sugar hydrolase/5'-nucleotidase [Halobacillus shinanisalinarum]UOQ94251.1 bifunctional metallophosphatase/5'-nucleotidase [Halobacillus shinanisalinarum]
MKEKIFLYYTSDLHSHFENWPQIVGYFNQRKKIHHINEESYWLLDNGDHVDRFHPITEGLMGKGNVELLNQAGYSFANLGNNEGITLSYGDLYSLYEEADFDVVCANLQSQTAPQPDWLKPYKIFQTKYGTRIAVLGLTAPFETFYSMLGWSITSPFDILDKLITEVQKQADIVVLLSHLGMYDDEEIARHYPGIDVIIGGHTHHLFQNGEHTGNSILTAVGKHGTHLGEIILEWDHAVQSLSKKEAYAVSTENMEKDSLANEQVEKMRERAVEHLQTPVAYLEHPLKIAWFKETPLMKRFTKGMQDWTGADLAMLNAGVLLDHLGEGQVTSEDIHRICPHPMNPCKVELSGDELLEVIRVAHTRKLTEIRLKGLGFRGEVIGKMVFTGVDIEVFEGSDDELHVKSVRMNGMDIDKQKTYTLATADTFTFGRLFPEIAYAEYKRYYMPELLRDVLAKSLGF